MSSCSAAVLPGETDPTHADKSGKSPGAMAVDFLFPVSSLRSQRCLHVCLLSVSTEELRPPASFSCSRSRWDMSLTTAVRV